MQLDRVIWWLSSATGASLVLVKALQGISLLETLSFLIITGICFTMIVTFLDDKH